MIKRPVRVLSETKDGILVVFDDTGEALILTGVQCLRTNYYGNVNDFVVLTPDGRQITEDSGIPNLQPCEIIFEFCDSCGMDYLVWPGTCTCGGQQHHTLGTQQGIVWRNRKFGKTYKSRSVR